MLLLACSGSSGTHGGGDSSASLPEGVYDLKPPACLTSGKAPAYPTASHKAVFGAFDELTSATMTLSGSEAHYVFTDADCTLTVARLVHQNENANFSLKLARTHTFEPEGCLLTLVQKGARFEAGRGYGDLFTDQKDFREEVPFDVAASDRTYTLTSDDREDLDKLWGSYGCAPADRLVTIYNLSQ